MNGRSILCGNARRAQGHVPVVVALRRLYIAWGYSCVVVFYIVGLLILVP